MLLINKEKPSSSTPFTIMPRKLDHIVLPREFKVHKFFNPYHNIFMPPFKHILCYKYINKLTHFSHDSGEVTLSTKPLTYVCPTRCTMWPTKRKQKEKGKCIHVWIFNAGQYQRFYAWFLSFWQVLRPHLITFFPKSNWTSICKASVSFFLKVILSIKKNCALAR